MASNQGVVYLGPGKVEVQSIDYPELRTPQGRKIDHGVIIKPITTNICGSDQHMVRVAQSVELTASQISGRLHHVQTGEIDAVMQPDMNSYRGHCRQWMTTA